MDIDNPGVRRIIHQPAKYAFTVHVYDASPDHLRRYKLPLQPGDLAFADSIGFTGMQRFHLVKGTASVRIAHNPTILVDDLTPFRELIAQGSGIGWLPDLLAQAAPGRLVPRFQASHNFGMRDRPTAERPGLRHRPGPGAMESALLAVIRSPIATKGS